MSKLEKELAWYKAYADQVQSSNHRAHEYACEHADEVTGVIQFPYEEGDDYWILQELAETELSDSYGIFSNGILAVQSCWDDQSKDFHREDPDREYFDSLEEILQHARDTYDFIQVECHYCDMTDIESGDFLCADEETGKFRKSG